MERGPCYQEYTTNTSSSESYPTNESSGHYRAWDDTLPKRKKFRFIHWMSRTKTSRTRQTVRTATLHNLYNNNNINNRNGDQPCHEDAAADGGYRDMESATTNIVTHIQPISNPTTTHIGTEMFVIEYPQQISNVSKL
jgi:hypothetical protein